MVRARFDFDRQNGQGVERERGPTPDVTLARLRQVATRTSTPPAPLDSRLVEEVVHGEDIRRPLGIKRAYPRGGGSLGRCCYQARTPVFVRWGEAAHRLLSGRGPPTPDVSIGAGPEVSGPVLSLLMAVSGRYGGAGGDLDGPGVAALE